MIISVSPSFNYIGQVVDFYTLHASSAAVDRIATFLIMKQTMISHAECLLRFTKCLGCITSCVYICYSITKTIQSNITLTRYIRFIIENRIVNKGQNQ